MMMSGTSFRAGSRFSLLQTENPFIRGSSIVRMMRSGLSTDAVCSPTAASSTTVTAQPRFSSSPFNSPANFESLSKTSTFGMRENARADASPEAEGQKAPQATQGYDTQGADGRSNTRYFEALFR